MVKSIKSNLEKLVWGYLLPDSICYRIWYRKVFKRKLNLKNPQTFNEKIQWLKLHDRKPQYHNLVDKYEAKRIIGSIIGEEYIVKTYGVWDRWEDIDFSQLPDSFVLKFTHDSNSVTICRDKSKLDRASCASKYSKSFKNRDFYHREFKEWVYKGIKPRIIAEEYLQDDTYDDLTNYEFFCCNGKARCVAASVNKLSADARAYSYDLCWNRFHPGEPNLVKKPESLNLMIELAQKIAAYVNNPFVRVDFHDVNGHPYFGEVTFSPNAGLGRFVLDSDDYIFGSWIDLSRGAY